MSQVTAKEKLFKQPSEVRFYTMNFSNLLNTNDTITSIISASGSPAGLGISSTGISTDSLSVNLTIASGVDATDYYVAIRVGTDGGETLEGDGILLVRDT